MPKKIKKKNEKQTETEQKLNLQLGMLGGCDETKTKLQADKRIRFRKSVKKIVQILLIPSVRSD